MLLRVRMLGLVTNHLKIGQGKCGNWVACYPQGSSFPERGELDGERVFQHCLLQILVGLQLSCIELLWWNGNACTKEKENESLPRILSLVLSLFCSFYLFNFSED